MAGLAMLFERTAPPETVTVLLPLISMAQDAVGFREMMPIPTPSDSTMLRPTESRQILSLMLPHTLEKIASASRQTCT